MRGYLPRSKTRRRNTASGEEEERRRREDEKETERGQDVPDVGVKTKRTKPDSFREIEKNLKRVDAGDGSGTISRLACGNAFEVFLEPEVNFLRPIDPRRSYQFLQRSLAITSVVVSIQRNDNRLETFNTRASIESELTER